MVRRSSLSLLPAADAELAPFEHERAAWVRHMLAAEPPDLAAYLRDTFRDGPAGG
jgi:hypothetical protein